MKQLLTLDEGLNIMQEGIVRARDILCGFPTKALFTGEDMVKYYHCVYCLCTEKASNDDNPEALYTKYKAALEESIVTVVLPSLMNKHDAPLLIEFVQMWQQYKSMAKCLFAFFAYLDVHFVRLRRLTSLKDVSVDFFCDLVCNRLFYKFRDVAIAMIQVERDGKQIDCNTLKNFLTFFSEIGQKGSAYYENFEQVLLADTASYYSRFASEWIFRDSFTDYMLKVEWCLNQEKKRVSQYLRETTTEKLLQVVEWHLLGQNESQLKEKQKLESHEQTTYQELLSKCSGMSLEERNSGLPSW